MIEIIIWIIIGYIANVIFYGIDNYVFGEMAPILSRIGKASSLIPFGPWILYSIILSFLLIVWLMLGSFIVFYNGIAALLGREGIES